jgi:hypothetical protein
MKNKRSKIIGAFIFCSVFSIINSAFSMDNIPKGWIKTGSDPKAYEVGVDKKVIGNNSTYISSVTEDANGFGTLMQTIPAKKYLGKRLKMSGFVKTENVSGWSGLWMRIDGNNKNTLGFDNMENRSITGTTAWKKYDIVLDVPKDSKYIAFGILLGGKGKAWLDDISFETVKNTIKTTNINVQLQEDPVNLNFEN